MAAATTGSGSSTGRSTDPARGQTTGSRHDPGAGTVSPPHPAPRTNTVFALLHGRQAGLVGALAVAIAWGALAGWWTPRGPVTTVEALVAVAASLVVGVVGGWLTRSRWAMLLAPVTFVAVFELTRLRVDGPMADGIHASFYGAIALITGRG